MGSKRKAVPPQHPLYELVGRAGWRSSRSARPAMPLLRPDATIAVPNVSKALIPADPSAGPQVRRSAGRRRG